MELNLQIYAGHSSLCDPPSKISSSQGTDASNQPVLGKKISLISCASSISVQQNGYLQTANEIFAFYLFANDENTKRKHYQRMKNHFIEIEESQPERIQPLSMLKFNIFEEDTKVLNHFIASWLLFMGYGTCKHRNYFLNRIKLIAGESKIPTFAKTYKNLSLLGLSDVKMLQFLLETCKNGWQYFIREVVRLELSLQVKDLV